jgi:hypothetical protein
MLRMAAAAAGATVMGGVLVGCGGGGAADLSRGRGDLDIINAAKVAEALATTMYTGIIGGAAFAALDPDDQDYFRAARDEEKVHYDLLKASSGNVDAPLTYYFPVRMFDDLQTTLNVLVTLEDAFIAAYLLGVRQFSTPQLRVLAAQIMGIESDHRTLARVVAQAEGLATTTGLSGSPEPVNPPNNNIFERTYGVTSLGQVVSALRPFFDAEAAASAGHTVTRTFDPSYVPVNQNLFGSPPA